MADQSNEQSTTTWPQLAEALYSFLTGRGAVIRYEFQNMEVHVPASATPNAPQAPWKLNGTIVISTTEKKA